VLFSLLPFEDPAAAFAFGNKDYVVDQYIFKADEAAYIPVFGF